MTLLASPFPFSLASRHRARAGGAPQGPEQADGQPPVPTPLATPPQAQHLRTCIRFWAWAGAGALAIISLDLGPVTVLPALILLALVSTFVGRRHISALGFTTGTGLPLLWVAYVQREGPGTTCWHTASAAGCDQHLNPLPWLIAGLVLVLTGLIGQAFANRWP